jgi:probable HAF family extracellular repeat protein
MIEDRQPGTDHGRRSRRSVVALALVGVAAGMSVVAGERVADAADVSHEQIVLPFGGFFIGENGEVIDVLGDATNELAFPIVSVGEYVRYDENCNGVSESALYRAANGQISTFNVGTGGTEATDINDAGDIVGDFSTTPVVTDPTGFLRDGDTHEVRTIAVENARITAVNGINDRGELVGLYRNADGVEHGFYWINGEFTMVDVRGAFGTRLLDINDLGQITGVRINQDGSVGSGFLLDSFSDQSPTTISFDGYATTSPQRINDGGQILVAATNDGLVFDSFLLPAGVGGPMTEVNVRNSPSVLAAGLNDRRQIVGLYQTADDLDCPATDVAGKAPVNSSRHR